MGEGISFEAFLKNSQYWSWGDVGRKTVPDFFMDFLLVIEMQSWKWSIDCICMCDCQSRRRGKWIHVVVIITTFRASCSIRVKNWFWPTLRTRAFVSGTWQNG